MNGEGILTPTEFNELFGSVGTVPEGTKASNVLTIKQLSTEDIRSVFQGLVDGITVMTYSRPRPGSFSKQYKTGSASVHLLSGSLHYSSNTSTCKIKFNAACANAYGGGFFGDDGGDY